MIIRSFDPRDYEKLQRIHERFYKEEFSFDDFCSKFMDFFVVVENDEIVLAGGVRAIAESVIMTNKDIPVEIKRRALLTMLQTQLFTCGKLGYSQLHAFIQDDNWKRHLIKAGFKPCKGDALFIEV